MVDSPASRDLAALEKQMLRLERRLDRERRARQEAEQIAERGLRSLYDANKELDRRILERTAELHEALAVAEAANDAKSAFLGQMSHQINTPLNGLLGMLELLAGELSDQHSEVWHASAMRSARRLERLTTRLTTYVELETADLLANAPQRSLRSVLSGVHDRWHGPCLRAGQLLAVGLQAGTDSQMSAPPELDLLFDELLSNVVEHAGPGSVSIESTPGPSEGIVEVRISDPGTGLSDAQLERSRALDASPDQTKDGDRQIHLGLAIVDRIVSALAGWWDATQTSPASVSVFLPLAGANG